MHMRPVEFMSRDGKKDRVKNSQRVEQLLECLLLVCRDLIRSLFSLFSIDIPPETEDRHCGISEQDGDLEAVMAANEDWFETC
jgi:hypothetical protein